jgi:hypothetical protein
MKKERNHNNAKGNWSANSFMAGPLALMLIAGAVFVAMPHKYVYADTTTMPTISSVMATPNNTGATVTWTTDQSANSQVAFGTTSAYTMSTPVDSTMGTSHSVALNGLMSGTMYHYQVMSMGTGSSTTAYSADATFMTTGTNTGGTGSTTATSTNTGTGGTGTTTATSTGTGGMGTTTGTTTTGTLSNADLQALIAQLRSELSSLIQQLIMILNNGGVIGGGTTGGGTGGTTGAMGTIDQNGQSFSAGSSMDFSGRNFGHEQQITVMLNGQTVATAHADGGGNFSTGSIAVPSTPGTYVYTFMGSGTASTSATITVH